jgi:hypothetical protein
VFLFSGNQIPSLSSPRYGREGFRVTTFHAQCMQIVSRYSHHLGFQHGARLEIIAGAEQTALVVKILRDIPRLRQAAVDIATSARVEAAVTAIAAARDRAEVLGSPEKQRDPKQQMQLKEIENVTRGGDALSVEPDQERSDKLLAADFINWVAKQKLHGNAPRQFLGAVQDLYAEYQRRLETRNGIDLSDILVLAERLLRTNSEVATEVRSRISHVIVDEYQDTNELQLQILRQLVGPRGCVTVVGDDDQSIYGFRGAVGTFKSFLDAYPSAATMYLEQNHRSTQKIVAATSFMISHNEGRQPKNMWCNNAAGDPIEIAVCSSVQTEAQHIVNAIKRLTTVGATMAVGSGGNSGSSSGAANGKSLDAASSSSSSSSSVKTEASANMSASVKTEAPPPPGQQPQRQQQPQQRRRPVAHGDIAVLYRTRRASLEVEAALRRAGVPYNVSGGARLERRSDVADALAVMRVIAGLDELQTALLKRRAVAAGDGGDDDQSLSQGPSQSNSNSNHNQNNNPNNNNSSGSGSGSGGQAVSQSDTEAFGRVATGMRVRGARAPSSSSRGAAGALSRPCLERLASIASACDMRHGPLGAAFASVHNTHVIPPHLALSAHHAKQTANFLGALEATRARIIGMPIENCVDAVVSAIAEEMAAAGETVAADDVDPADPAAATEDSDVSIVSTIRRHNLALLREELSRFVSGSAQLLAFVYFFFLFFSFLLYFVFVFWRTNPQYISFSLLLPLLKNILPF